MPNAGTCTAPDLRTRLLIALAESQTAFMNAAENEYGFALLRFKNAWMLLRIQETVPMLVSGRSYSAVAS